MNMHKQLWDCLKINLGIHIQFSSVQFSRSVVSDSLQPHESHARPPCPSPTPGVYSTHVHRVGDAIQPFHPLLSPSPPAPNPSQHQGLFQWLNLHEVAKVLEFQLQHQSFQWTPRTDHIRYRLKGFYLEAMRWDWLTLEREFYNADLEKKCSTTSPVKTEWQSGITTSHIFTFGVTADFMDRW